MPSASRRGLLGRAAERLARQGAEEIFGVGELALLRGERGLRFIALLGERGLLGLQRFEPRLEVALLELERGELLLLALVQAFLRKLLFLDLGALGLDVADPRAEHLQRFLLFLVASLGSRCGAG